MKRIIIKLSKWYIKRYTEKLDKNLITGNKAELIKRNIEILEKELSRIEQ